MSNSKEKYNLALAKRFKSIRIQANLTQKKFAKELFVTPQQISNYENGRKRITEQIAHSAAMICGIDEKYLLDESVEYPTKLDEVNARLTESERNMLLYNRIIFTLFELNGYDVVVNALTGNDPIETSEHIKLKQATIQTADDVFTAMDRYLLVNGLTEISLNEKNALGMMINDLFLSWLKRFKHLEV